MSRAARLSPLLATCGALVGALGGPLSGAGPTAASAPPMREAPTHKTSAPAAPSAPTSDSPPALASAPEIERDAIDRLRRSASWVRRAIACERFARYDCEPSEVYLRELLRDSSWQVRCYALLACARRGIAIRQREFLGETEPRVIRTALRCRYAVPKAELETLAVRRASSTDLEDRMLGLELALAADIGDDTIDRDELVRSIVMRMDRVETGSLSPRLAAVTSGDDSGRSYRWREWYRKNRANLGLHGRLVVEESLVERDRGFIARLAPDEFASLERHVADLGEREIDVAIMLDCTASMSGELAECQAGIDALMLFVQGVARNVRIAVVGYRDRQDKWETQAYDFTASITDARRNLWMLSAEGGGDRPESVSAALKLAYSRLSWRTGKSLHAILIGDAPPHPGTGEISVDYARRARRGGVTTHAIAPHAPMRPTAGAPDAPTPSPAQPLDPGSDPELDPTKPYRRPEGAPPADAPDPIDAPTGPQQWFKRRKPAAPVSPWRREMAPGEVEYFAEIAAAGGGRAVSLPRDASLISEIAGITLGDKHRDAIEMFFAEWMALCR